MLSPLKRRVGLSLALAGLVLLAACGGDDSSSSGQAPTSTPIPTAPAVARPTYPVLRGDVQEILSFSGRWQPRDQMALSFEIGGTVRRVLVQRGDTVAAGQLLADYQIAELENQLASAQLDLETAQAELESGAAGSVRTITEAEIALANARLNRDNVKAGSPWTAVQSARIGLDSAEQALVNAQRAYDEAVSRPEEPASSVDQAYEQLQSAQTALRSAQASYDEAAQAFNSYQYQLASAENAVMEAELALERAKSGETLDVSKQQAVRAAQLQIDQITASIEQSSLYAPIDGEVLEVAIRPGAEVQPYTTVIVIGRPEPKEAIATLALSDTQRLSVGMIGVCQVINQPDTAVQCIIRSIPSSSRDVDQTTRVAASLDDVSTGELIEIQMPLQVRQDVLWLPPAAIRTFQNRVFVVLQTPDGERSVDVQLGLRTVDRIEIVSGVNEGDVVVGP
jgi:multidrug efflux pump subunit AcrA (membrane-fusion protein)